MIPTPKTDKPKDIVSLAHVTIMVSKYIGAVISKILLKVLLEPGSTKTFITKNGVPRVVNPAETGSQQIRTQAGTMETKEMVYLCNLRLPEFDKNRIIDIDEALIFYQKC